MIEKYGDLDFNRARKKAQESYIVTIVPIFSKNNHNYTGIRKYIYNEGYLFPSNPKMHVFVIFIVKSK